MRNSTTVQPHGHAVQSKEAFVGPLPKASHCCDGFPQVAATATISTSSICSGLRWADSADCEDEADPVPLAWESRDVSDDVEGCNNNGPGITKIDKYTLEGKCSIPNQGIASDTKDSCAIRALASVVDVLQESLASLRTELLHQHEEL